MTAIPVPCPPPLRCSWGTCLRRAQPPPAHHHLAFPWALALPKGGPGNSVIDCKPLLGLRSKSQKKRWEKKFTNTSSQKQDVHLAVDQQATVPWGCAVQGPFPGKANKQPGSHRRRLNSSQRICWGSLHPSPIRVPNLPTTHESLARERLGPGESGGPGSPTCSLRLTI